MIVCSAWGYVSWSNDLYLFYVHLILLYFNTKRPQWSHSFTASQRSICLTLSAEGQIYTNAELVRIHISNDKLFSFSLLPSQLTLYSVTTFLKVPHNIIFTLEKFTTGTTAKVFDIRVLQLMTSQCSRCTETHWTFTANIRLHTFMTTYMYHKTTTVAEFLLTNVTCQPSTFIVRPQQMCLDLFKPHKTFWTVSTWVRLCTSVNTNMLLEIICRVKLYSTVRTFKCPSVTVYMNIVIDQSTVQSKAAVTQWTLVRFVSRVYCHVIC